MNKISKVLLGLIYVLLLAFLGAGCYFIVCDVIGAGLVGIGVFLMGLGVTIFLQLGLSGTTRDVKNFGSGSDLHAQMEIPAQIRRIGNYDKSVSDGMVYICDNGLYLEKLYPVLLFIPYGQITTLKQDNGAVEIECGFELNGEHRTGTFEVKSSQTLKMKALLQTLQAKVKK